MDNPMLKPTRVITLPLSGKVLEFRHRPERMVFAFFKNRSHYEKRWAARGGSREYADIAAKSEIRQR